MVKCVFCGREEDSYKGISLINNNGTVEYYCSGKCQRNALHLKRDKRRLKWTVAYREEKIKQAQRAEFVKSQAHKHTEHKETEKKNK